LKGDLLGSGDGDDIVMGSQGNDTLLGGGGRDLIIAGAGDDNIIGDGHVVIYAGMLPSLATAPFGYSVCGIQRELRAA
jgi:Ca2+-binding RTX toxin-like protein